jgi:hypothetical protein
MAATNAERQRKYREKALKAPDGHLLTRLQTYLSPTAHRVLKDLARAWNCSQREVLERLLIERDPAASR